MIKIQRVKELIQSEFPEVANLFSKYRLLPDRVLLEKEIIPYFVTREEFYKIIFVGCEWYTKSYNKLFQTKEYWTIEIDENKKRYGSRKHISDALKNLDAHFSENYFDLILCNGVFLVGAIDTKEEAEESFEKCFKCLRKGGIFILGWNDTPEFRPFPPEECQRLSKFKPYIFPPLSTWQYSTRTSYKHVFNFYVKN